MEQHEPGAVCPTCGQGWPARALSLNRSLRHTVDAPAAVAAKSACLAESFSTKAADNIPAEPSSKARDLLLRHALSDVSATREVALRNSPLRRANLQAERYADPLQILAKERMRGPAPLGAKPAGQPAGGPFPATVAQLEKLSHQHLDALAEFYAEDFGPPGTDQRVRINRFSSFIGAALPYPFIRN